MHIVYWMIFCGVVTIINILLYNKIYGKPKIVKDRIIKYVAHIFGAVPFLQLSLMIVYIVMLFVIFIENEDSNKWYNKPIK